MTAGRPRVDCTDRLYSRRGCTCPVCVLRYREENKLRRRRQRARERVLRVMGYLGCDRDRAVRLIREGFDLRSCPGLTHALTAVGVPGWRAARACLPLRWRCGCGCVVVDAGTCPACGHHAAWAPPQRIETARRVSSDPSPLPTRQGAA